MRKPNDKIVEAANKFNAALLKLAQDFEQETHLYIIAFEIKRNEKQVIEDIDIQVDHGQAD